MRLNRRARRSLGLLVSGLWLSLGLAAAAQAVTFADGQVHVIGLLNSYPLEDVIVEDGPAGAVTRLEVEEGGLLSTLTGGQTSLYGQSEFLMTGGEVNRLYAYDASSLEIVNGWVRSTLNTGGTSTTSITDGQFSTIQNC